MDSSKLRNSNSAAIFNGGLLHRDDQLASPDHFLGVEAPLIIKIFPIFAILQYFINVPPLESLIPLHSLDHLFYFFTVFAGSGEVGYKIEHSSHAAPGRG
jgi:hypothetical protein